MEAQSVLFIKGKKDLISLRWRGEQALQHLSDNSTTNKLNNEAVCPTCYVKAVNIQSLKLQPKSQDCILNRSDRMHARSFHFGRIYQACLLL